MTGRAAAALVGGCLVAGLATFTWKAPPVHATVTPPGTITTYAGSSGFGPATNVPQEPSGLALSGNTLYVSDFKGYVVRALNLTTGDETVVAGTGDLAATGDGGPATSAGIGYPEQLALDGGGNLYIAAVERIRKVTPGGIIITVAGGGSGGLGDGGAATAATLLAGALTVTANGDLYIADSGHNRVRKVDHLAPHLITTVAGNGVQGFSGDGGLATAAELNSPEGLLVDGTGKLWIADGGNNRVRVVDPVTHIITTVAGAGYNQDKCVDGDATGVNAKDIGFPYGLWMNNAGLLYIASSGGCVQTLQSDTLTTIAGCANCNTSGDDLAPLSTSLDPLALVGDAAGNLFIADSGHDKLRKLPSGQNVLHTIAGNGKDCATTVSGSAAAAYICHPGGLAIDGGDNVFIADPLGEVVEKVTPNGSIGIVAGNGTYGFSGDGGSATAAQLRGPASVAVDSSGTLFIAEFDRIRKVSGGIITTLAQVPNVSSIAVDPTTGDVIAADNYDQRIYRVTPAGLVSSIAGTGVAGFSGDGGPATSAKISYPGGLAVDAGGDIYIDDTGNERLRKIDTSGVITTFAALANVSQFTPGSGVAVGPGGQIIVSGAYNPSVLLVSPTGIVQTIAGSTTLGFAGDGGPAAAALFNTPSGAAFDSAGDLFIGDGGNHRVRRIETFGATSAPTNVKATPGFDSAHVTWTAPANDTGLPVVQYTVTAYVGASPVATVRVSGNPAARAATFTSLVAGTAYTFAVVASNAWLPSPASQHSSPITVLAHPARGTIATWTGTPGSGAAKSVGQLPYAIGINGIHVYVGDLGTGVIRDLNTQSLQESVLAGNGGLGYSGNGGPALKAMLFGSTAIAVCGGNTYFDDTLNYVIRKIDAQGVVTVFAGTGEPGYSGDGGPAKFARITRVLGLACRSGGGLYLTDSDNGAVRIIDATGKITTWWIGFSFPTGITEMAPDVVAVSDSGSDNAVFQLTDTQAYLLAGTPGQAGDDNGAVLAQYSHLNDPRGLAYNSGSGLFIADSGNNRIKQLQQGWVYEMAGTGVAGFTGDGVSFQVELNEPTDIQWLSNGYHLIVADTGNNRVRDINMSGGPFMTTIAGNGTPSRSGDGGSSIDAQVGNPYAVAVDAAGNQYVADNLDNVIRKIDVDGVITTVAGTGDAGYTGDGGAATSATLDDPRGVAVASDGSLYISDTGNQVVRKVDPAGNISTFAGNGVAGYTGDGVLATSTRINFPRAVALGPSGDLYIADTANNRVRKVDHSSHVITTVAGDGVGRFNGDNQPATVASLKGPRGLAFDAAGALYIGDSDNNRVRKVDAGVITTVAGTGTAGVRGDGRQATAAELDFPFGLAFDGAGDLYIADSGNSRVRFVTPSGKISTVVGVCGPGFGGDWEPAFSALINFPYGLGVDANGTIYIADSSNNRVRIVYGLDTARTASCQSAGGGVAGSRTSHPSNGSSSPSIAIEQATATGRVAGVAAFDAPRDARPAAHSPVRATHTKAKQPAGTGSAKAPVVRIPTQQAPPQQVRHDVERAVSAVAAGSARGWPYLLPLLLTLPAVIGAIGIWLFGRRRARRRDYPATK